MNEKDDLDFEISFYEALIKDKPDFVDALIPLANAYTKRGLYKKGLEVDKRLVGLRPDDEMVHYNLACSYSLLGNIDLALKTLEKAMELGYRDFNWMEKDKDLENLRNDKRYKELLLRFKKG